MDLKTLRDDLTWGLSKNLRSEDDELLYCVLEQFPLTAYSDLHQSNLSPLLERADITKHEFEIAESIRNLFVELNNDLDARSLEAIRGGDARWKILFNLCDQLHASISKRLH